jgi:multimeric flavodoxin WrbA
MKNILIITGSPREGGNSDALAEAFAEGAKKAGHAVTFFHAGRASISGCKGCNTCFTKGAPCSFNDDFKEMAALVEAADAVVFSTPVYWFSFPAQLMAAIDKLYSFYYATAVGRYSGPGYSNIKQAVLIAAGGDEEVSVFDALVATWHKIRSNCGWENSGVILVPNVNKKGDALKTPQFAEVKALGEKF